MTTELSIMVKIISVYLLVCLCICLYWWAGREHKIYYYRLWMADHKILTNIIATGGFISTWFMISIGTFKLLWGLSLVPYSAIEWLLSLLPEEISLEIDRDLFVGLRFLCSVGFGFVVTVLFGYRLWEFIKLEANKGRTQAIQHDMEYLRRYYNKDKDIDCEGFSAEENKRYAIAEVRAQIDELEKDINSTTKGSRFYMVRQDKLEALYKFLNEVTEGKVPEND